MSLNRENVTWQSEDGTWSIGFYEATVVGDDPEWDVEYGDNLDWVSTGHPDANAAQAAWTGSNPGGTTKIPWSEANRDDCVEFDDKAAQGREAGAYCKGPKKRRLTDAQREGIRLRRNVKRAEGGLRYSRQVLDKGVGSGDFKVVARLKAAVERREKAVEQAKAELARHESTSRRPGVVNRLLARLAAPVRDG